MRFLNKKRVVFGLLLLIFVGVLVGFTPKSASAFMPYNYQQDVFVINASDTNADETESDEDDDDDEWEA